MTENLLYMKSKSEEEVNTNDDAWDDSLLVQSYDSAVQIAKEQIAQKLKAEKNPTIKENAVPENRNEQQPRSHTSKRPKWKVGMHCRAVYSVDSREYEATIKCIDEENGVCLIKYIGYDNEEEIELDSLLPSYGREAQLAQKAKAREEEYRKFHQHNNSFNECNKSFLQNTTGMIPPPPPPFVMASLPKDETDALSAMLMSWYMSGYHTGYYQGLTRSKMPDRSFSYRNGH